MIKIKIVILTGGALRHDFVRKAIALDPKINVLKSYCEKNKNTLKNRLDISNSESQIQLDHLKARDLSESDFFSHFVELTPDKSNPKLILPGEINDEKNVDEIIELNPDLIIAYGCSLIKSKLLSVFKGRFINVHLGLSPYYRGSGTNFWALVNNEPEFVGATFMYIDSGIDTGKIIHQIRARIYKGDTPHMIGNRLISDIAKTYIKIIINFNNLLKMEQIKIHKNSSKIYFRKHFTPDSVKKLYENFDKGLVNNYLNEIELKTKKVKLVINPILGKF